MKQEVKNFLATGGFAVLAGLAIFFAVVKVNNFRGNGEAGAMIWFYDQNAKHLYPAPRDLIPPDGNDGARVRAMVIGFQGIGNGVNQLKIAYLEKYTPEFKALLERAEAAHAAKRLFAEKVPSQTSAYFQDNTLVKRPDDATWFTVGTAEARRIKTEWREWRGPGGQSPIISVPSLQ